MQKILASLVAGLLLLSSIATASASFYLNPNEPGESWLLLEGTPGQEIEGEFVLVNGGEEDGTFELSVLHATKTTEVDGSFELADDAAIPEGMAVWTTLSEDMVDVEAGGQQVISVRVQIPEDAPFGEHWGGITGMEVEKESEELGASGVVILVKNGMRMRVTVITPEDYVPPAEGEEEEGESGGMGDFQPYLIGIVVVIVLAGIVAVLSRKKTN